MRTKLFLRLLSFQETFQLASKPFTFILRSLSTGLLNRQLHLANNVDVAAAFPSPTFLHHNHNRSPQHLAHKHRLTCIKPRQIIQQRLPKTLRTLRYSLLIIRVSNPHNYLTIALTQSIRMNLRRPLCNQDKKHTKLSTLSSNLLYDSSWTRSAQ